MSTPSTQSPSSTSSDTIDAIFGTEAVIDFLPLSVLTPATIVRIALDWHAFISRLHEENAPTEECDLFQQEIEKLEAYLTTHHFHGDHQASTAYIQQSIKTHFPF